MSKKVPVGKSLAKAKSLERRGRVSEARAVLQEILKEYPANKSVAAYLVSLDRSDGENDKEIIGLISNGQLDDAAEIIKSGESTGDFETYSNLLAREFNSRGDEFFSQGQLEKAIVQFKKALAFDPGNPVFLNNYGLTAHQTGQYEEAIRSFRLGLAGNDKLSNLYLNLGDSLSAVGDLSSAISSYDRCIALDPRAVDALNNSAGAYLRSHNYRVAIQRYQEVLEIEGRTEQVLNDLGRAFRMSGDLKSAVEAHSEALALAPESSNSSFLLGRCFQETGQSGEAESFFLQALKLDPNMRDAHLNLANILSELREFERAEHHFEMAKSLGPEDADLWNNIATHMQSMGNLKEARISYERAIAIDPKKAAVFYNYSALHTFKENDSVLAKVEALYHSTITSEEDRINICFALAKAYRDLGWHQKEFKILQEGNQLRKDQLGYDFHKDKSEFRRVRETFWQYIHPIKPLPKKQEKVTPIFVLGMPRSGTTLVEQVLSAHSVIAGAGELSFLSDRLTDFLDSPRDITEESLSKVRAEYLEYIGRFSDTETYVVDKMPHNFRFIGFIRWIFPEAKIIECVRDPAAVCWSNFSCFFPRGLGYSCSLEDVVQYYLEYEHLMAFWKKNLPSAIYSFEYQYFTMAQEERTKQLLSYLNVGFEVACLFPEKNLNAVNTASNVQVRRPVYTGSSEAWKSYEDFIGGVFDGLKS